jgi:hypothetical protein
MVILIRTISAGFLSQKPKIICCICPLVRAHVWAKNGLKTAETRPDYCDRILIRVRPSYPVPEVHTPGNRVCVCTHTVCCSLVYSMCTKFTLQPGNGDWYPYFSSAPTGHAVGCGRVFFISYYIRAVRASRPTL